MGGYFDEIGFIKAGTMKQFKAAFQNISDHLRDHPELIAAQKGSNKDTVVENGLVVPRTMVKTNKILVDLFFDKYYDDILKLFVLNEKKCCGKAMVYPPANDEVVLHLRNFATELDGQEKREKMGFQELDSHRISTEVLGHLKAGDKLALVGRNLESDAQDKSTEAYQIVSALEPKNLTLRYSSFSSPLEDFCFLKKTKRELIGNYKSTFLTLAAFWAGSSLKSIKLYQYTSSKLLPGRKSKKKFFRNVLPNGWTNPELRAKVRLEDYFENGKSDKEMP